MKRFVEGTDRRQSTLFPAVLDDYVGDDNPVRAIDVFVDGLDLVKLGFDGVAPLATGRPAYHPAPLLKIYIYGYFNRVQSSRRLERECQRNVELVWLTGHLMPDFKTIADFRKDNGEAIRKVCRAFVLLCRRLDLLDAASVAIDGSKFKAVNNRDKNFTEAKMKRRLEQIDESIARYLSQLDTADRQGPTVPEAKTTRLKEKIAKLREEIERLNALNARMMASEDKQISLSDPDARSMATSGKGSGMVGYNVQSAVDTTHHLIVAHEVTNVGTDRSQLSNIAEQADRDGSRDPRCRGRSRILRQPGDIGLRDRRHHGHTTEADDFERLGGGPFRQARLRLRCGRRCLLLSGRRAADLSVHDRGSWQDAAPLLDHSM